MFSNGRDMKQCQFLHKAVAMFQVFSETAGLKTRAVFKKLFPQLYFKPCQN